MYDFGEFRAEGPVMTFCVDGTWLCVRLEQLDSIAQPERLCPVPLSAPQHVGLMDRGDSLVPVMTLTPSDDDAAAAERLIAVLRVRGEPVGLCIDRAGRMEERYWVEEASTPPPDTIAHLEPARLMVGKRANWLIDADRLWTDGAVQLSSTQTLEATPGTSPGQTKFTD